jgi:NAD(P)-dependent dehydrogenase (short-subunit alcohol dehydrogenase family)
VSARVLPHDFVDSIFSLTGRVAVVTGSASGLGAAIAVGLAQAGAHVVVVDTNEAGAAVVASEASQFGGISLAVACDVTDGSSLAGLAERVHAEFGRIDVLVNSAGTAHRSPAEDFPEEAFDAVLAVNLKGTFLPCQTFGTRMLAAGAGSIINLASIGGFVAYPHASAYLSSKGAVIQLTRALALEWIGRVRVNAIAPTLFRTPLTARGEAASSVTSDFIRARMPRPDRLGEPHEIVGAAVFLASDASALVTGHTLPVDDGYLIA